MPADLREPTVAAQHSDDAILGTHFDAFFLARASAAFALNFDM